MSLAEKVQAGAKIAKGLESAPKILTIDIETSPNLAYVWGLWDQNVGLSQIVETGEVMCFSAKWYGQREVIHFSNHEHGHETMINAAWELLNDAEVVTHYNGKNFDIKWLYREFVLAGLAPPSPHKDIDLLSVVKSRFKFASNKLDHVAQELGLGKKTAHSGFDLWVKCMADDPKAWALMKRYCSNDVVLTEKLYDRLRPWIKGHPHIGFYADSDQLTCDKCGSTDLHRDGTYTAHVIKYVRYRCGNCSGWVRGGMHSRQAVTRGVA